MFALYVHSVCFSKSWDGRPEDSMQGLKMVTTVHSSNHSAQDDDSFADEMAGQSWRPDFQAQVKNTRQQFCTQKEN